MKVSGALVALILIVGNADFGFASEGTGDAGIISRGPNYAPGVEATAESVKPHALVTTTHGVAAVVQAAPEEQPPVPLAYIPNACGGIYGTLDLSDLPTFPQATADGCNAFLVPPAPREARARERPRRPAPGALAAAAADRVRELAPEPNLALAPSEIGLTGLDSYFWLDDPPGPISATARAGPLTVTAEARPVRYIWDFGDGDDLVTAHPGRRWTRSRPGNIAHLYETRGSYDLSVEVVWAARWRVNDGEWQPLGYFSNSDERRYRVRQIVAVLTRAE